MRGVWKCKIGYSSGLTGLAEIKSNDQISSTAVENSWRRSEVELGSVACMADHGTREEKEEYENRRHIAC